jgi:hypothetical protein
MNEVLQIAANGWNLAPVAMRLCFQNDRNKAWRMERPNEGICSGVAVDWGLSITLARSRRRLCGSSPCRRAKSWYVPSTFVHLQKRTYSGGIELNGETQWLPYREELTEREGNTYTIAPSVLCA